MIFEPAQRVVLPTKDLLSWIFDDPPYNQDEPIYIDVQDPTRSISCNQARKIIRQLIAGFKAAGLRQGDCVLIHSFNDIYYCILVLAIVGTGGIYTGTNPTYTPAELVHHCKAAQVKYIISEPEILKSLLAAAKEVQIPEQNLWIFDVFGQQLPDGAKSYTELLKFGESDWIRFNDLKTVQETSAARFFSSGTTGLPKATTITHYNMIAQHELAFGAHPKPYQISRVVATPIFHAAAAPSTHFGALRSGDVIYMMRRFELEVFLTAIEKYQVTDIILVPPIAIAMIMSPFSRKRPFLKSLRAAVCGAAPLDKDAQARLGAMMAEGAPVTQVWGMTETSCIAMMFPFPEGDDSGSVGRLIPNVEAKLIDDNGNNISAFGVSGELCVRGPTVTPGYFNSPEANAASFDSDGWFKTGDIAYCDKNTRKWYIVDRKKELIKVRGFQVAPPELEAVLLSHPQIIDAAVIGVSPQGSNVELPRAYVVRRPGPEGHKLTVAQIQEYMGTRLAKYKALTGGVKFVNAIPKTASGKILKRVLREESKKDRETGNWRANL